MKKSLNTSSNRLQRSEEGFTLIELLVVLGIIALLMTLVAPQVIRYLSGAKSETASVQLKNLESALELYYLDTGQYPSNDSGTRALIEKPSGANGWHGPYIKRESGLQDPWGKPFIYRSPGEHGAYDLYSLGRDEVAGGEEENRDIVNW
jgi:general secretion pathway protein G